MKHVLVTGVSTGIGYAVASELLQRGYGVFGSVRRPEDAHRLSQALGDRFTPLVFDVTDSDAIAAAAQRVNDVTGTEGLAGLVNNAGVSLPGPLGDMPAAQIRQQLEVNVMGVVHVTQAFLPSLGAAGPRTAPPGRIVNISSVSGRIAYPFMGAYAASKHALEALSDAWRRELMLYGIDVIVVQPGAIKTPIWDKSSRISTDYPDSDFAPILQRINLAHTERIALPVEKVTRVIVRALESRRPKTRYVIPHKWLMYWLLPRYLPDRWLDAAISRMLGLRKRTDAEQ